MTLGEKIYQRRTDLGLTQADVGRRVGRTGACVGRWENGDRPIDSRDLEKLAEALQTQFVIGRLVWG